MDDGAKGGLNRLIRVNWLRWSGGSTRRRFKWATQFSAYSSFSSFLACAALGWYDKFSTSLGALTLGRDEINKCVIVSGFSLKLTIFLIEYDFEFQFKLSVQASFHLRLVLIARLGPVKESTCTTCAQWREVRFTVTFISFYCQKKTLVASIIDISVSGGSSFIRFNAKCVFRPRIWLPSVPRRTFDVNVMLFLVWVATWDSSKKGNLKSFPAMSTTHFYLEKRKRANSRKRERGKLSYLAKKPRRCRMKVENQRGEWRNGKVCGEISPRPQTTSERKFHLQTRNFFRFFLSMLMKISTYHFARLVITKLNRA